MSRASVESRSLLPFRTGFLFSVDDGAMILHVSKPMISVCSDFNAMLLSRLVLLGCNPTSLSFSYLLNISLPEYSRIGCLAVSKSQCRQVRTAGRSMDRARVLSFIWITTGTFPRGDVNDWDLSVALTRSDLYLSRRGLWSLYHLNPQDQVAKALCISQF